MESASLQAWPDALHLVLLRHLGSPQQVHGYLWPYSTLCRVCHSATQQPSLWRDIDMSNSELDNPTFADVFSLICRCGRHALERLSLRGVAEVDDSAVAALVELLTAPDGTRLRSLDMGTCPGVSGQALLTLRAFTELEELSIECLDGLEDAHLEALCSACPRLARLDVRFCELLTDVSVLLRRPSTWASLQLDGCFRLDVGRLLAEPRGSWDQLQELSVDGEDLSAEQLASIATVCPKLRCLAVSFARELDATALAELASLAGLEELTLRKANSPGDLDWVAFLSEQRAARARRGGGAQWRLLNFAECELFADGAALALAASPLPALIHLDLSWCWHLSDAGLSGLLSVAPGLRHVKIAGTKSVTALGLAPCSRMPGLEELDCTSCNSVADGMLEFLHRLFAAPPGTCEEALPAGELPARVGRVAAVLWRQRRRGSPQLQARNYYGEYLENWPQMRPPRETCDLAETMLAELGEPE